MSEHEEELQNKIEAGHQINVNDADAKAYERVFRVLSREPRVKLKSNFADTIVANVAARKQKESSSDILWLTFGVFFLAIGFVIAGVAAGLKLDFGFLKDMSSYAGVFIFAACFIVLLNWLDKRILRPEHKGGFPQV